MAIYQHVVMQMLSFEKKEEEIQKKRSGTRHIQGWNGENENKTWRKKNMRICLALPGSYLFRERGVRLCIYMTTAHTLFCIVERSGKKELPSILTIYLCRQRPLRTGPLCCLIHSGYIVHNFAFSKVTHPPIRHTLATTGRIQSAHALA